MFWLPPRACTLILLFLILSPSCKTPGETENGSRVKGVELGSEENLNLGSVTDSRLKTLFYQGIEGTLAARDAASDGQDGSSELGEMDSFRFTIMRLTKGEDDVTGNPGEKPNGMEVEVTGWYKRTQASGERGKATEHCASFDMRILAVKIEGLWQLRDKIPLSIGREDPEDCY